MPVNEKGSFPDLDIDHRKRITKVRGGWTEKKVIKELKAAKGTEREASFLKDIAMYDTPEEFEENLFYHGSGRSIGLLKPSVVLGNTDDFGGGYGEKYYGVSLSKDRDIASNFTGLSRTGNVAPVLLKRGTIVKEMPELSDANEIDEILLDLWTEGVDAVKIGDHTKDFSEQEIVVLNPRCLSVGPSQHFAVFQKKKMPSFDKETLVDMWINSSDKYKELAIKSWDDHDDFFEKKFGKRKDPSQRWNSKQESLFNYHKHNVELYEKNQLKNDDIATELKDEAVENSILDFLNENKEKPKAENKSKRRNRPS